MDDMNDYYNLPPTGLRSYYHRLSSPLSGAAVSRVLPPPPLPPPHDSSYHFPHQPNPNPNPNPNLDPYAYVLASSPLPSHDEVRTLFVAGLPEDVKPREIYNLFREFPGYASSNLRTAGRRDSQPFAFAVFTDQQSAVTAMHALNGMVFDLEKGSTLYVDLAKTNSRSKRSRAGDEDGPDSHKKFKGRSFIPMVSIDPGVGSHHISGLSNSAHDMIGYTTALRGNNETGAAQPASRNNPPCPTLFVANLGQRCKENELIQVFSRCRGFIKLKVQSNYGTPVAFVDFEDTVCSTEALHQLQGAILYFSGGEGMRLEYAKARMGMRKRS